jgi:hypothetical protein
MPAIGFLLPVLSMFVGIATSVTMGRFDDWQWGSGIGLAVGCLAAALLMLGMRLGRAFRRAQLTYRAAITSSRSLKYSSD